jgi:hypothetical protein
MSRDVAIPYAASTASSSLRVIGRRITLGAAVN